MRPIWVQVLVFLSFFCYSSAAEIKDVFLKKAQDLYPEAVRIRRFLHQHPELCNEEKETAAFVSGYLKRLGLEVQTGIGGNGIKAILRGSKDRPAVAIRADLDALPIQEKTGFEFSSRNPGKMHACGHDVHLTDALMAARLLVDVKDQLAGTVVFIIQPCEEGTSDGSSGGAETLIKAGILENPPIEALFGHHLLPELPAGTISFRPGALMANVAWLTIRIAGKASHGAFPHQGIDAIYAAASAIVQFQSIISRLKDPAEKAVLSIGKINGGTRANVIASEVTLEGTVRTFSFATEQLIEKKIKEILQGLQAVYGIDYRCDFVRANPYVKNDEKLSSWARSLFEKVLGGDRVKTAESLTIGEDFALYSHTIPALFVFLGTGSPTALHSAEFTVDEAILKTGPMVLALSAFSYLQDRSIHAQAQR